MGSAAKAHAGLASELAQAEIRQCVRDDVSYLGFRVLVPPPPLPDSDWEGPNKRRAKQKYATSEKLCRVCIEIGRDQTNEG